jgi:hypothetical protein
LGARAASLLAAQKGLLNTVFAAVIVIVAIFMALRTATAIV